MSNQPLRGEDFWRTDPGPREDVSPPAHNSDGESQRNDSWQTAAAAWESEPAETAWPETTESTESTESTETPESTWPAAAETAESTWPATAETAESTWPAAAETEEESSWPTDADSTESTWPPATEATATEATEPAAHEEAPPPRRDRRINQVLWFAAATLVIGIPVVVGIVAFLQPPGPSQDAAEGEPVVATAATPAPAPAPAPGLDRLAPTRPAWTRPTWASSVSGATVYELQSSTDVPFATGRMRPRLGLRCTDGSLDVHVVTGGTAHIDPETSRHVVLIGFDGAASQPQRWVGAADQQALFAPDPEGIMARIAQAGELEFAYTHYMAGPTPVSFNLTGADEIVESVASACG